MSNNFIIGIYEFNDPTLEELEETVEELEMAIDEAFELGENEEADEYISQLNEIEEIIEEIGDN